jgi:hypothetical protein
MSSLDLHSSANSNAADLAWLQDELLMYALAKAAILARAANCREAAVIRLDSRKWQETFEADFVR